MIDQTRAFRSVGQGIDLLPNGLKALGFPQSIQEIIRLSAKHSLISRPYYIHRVSLSDAIAFPKTSCLQAVKTEALQPPWQMGRVVLVGDAAHGMPPFMAQGVNQGLEDAFVVATLIGCIRDQQAWNHSEAIDYIFKIYEQLRRPLTAQVQKATIERYDNSAVARQAYEQQVYQRNLAQELEAALRG